MRSFFLVLVLVGTLGFLGGCGGGGTPSGLPITITLSPTSASLNEGGVVNIVATVANDSSNAGVSWSLSPSVGALSAQTTTSVTYTAPAVVTTTTVVNVVATSIASSSVTASLPITISPSGTATNVLPIAVNGGLSPTTAPYLDAAFASVTVCVPGTSTCQTIDNILVDTGSYGLRLLGSQVTIPLVALVDNNKNTLYNCVNFQDGSFLWGTVAPANIQMAGEVAQGTSIQLIANPSFSIPSGCTGTNEDTQALLGANGILGIGPEPFDCGTACDPTQNGGNPPPVYYLCSSGGSCNVVSVSCGTLCGDTVGNQQITNPVFNFPADNNGTIVELPALPAGQTSAPSVSGSLYFGIGTQANNAVPTTATLFLLNPGEDLFTTNFNGLSLTSSFIDSGSNGLFFPQVNNLPNVCSDNNSWYCPPTTTAYTATNIGPNGTPSNTVNFSVDNFDNVTAANPNDTAFSNLAGPNANGFDWGLPFFFGRNVFTAIDGTTTPAGAGPFWAY